MKEGYVPTANALKVLERRYLLRDSEGNIIETPDALMHRVAKKIASVEEAISRDNVEEEFYQIFRRGWFLPNSPTLMNAGTKTNMLSACFVLPIDDSIGSILESVKNTGIIFKLGGGTGLNFSHLRPEGSYLNSTGGHSSGPLSFMRIFDVLTKVIAQGGKRRGALMGILSVEHPDILSFILAKTKEKSLNGFNLSVGITDLFCTDVKNNPENDHIVTDPHTGKKHQLRDENGAVVSVQQLFDLITLSSWESGEPGVVFLDRLQSGNPVPSLIIDCTNPCGEVPLPPNGSCTLGSIDISKFVKEHTIDYSSLKVAVRIAVRFLDNTISVNEYPLPEIGEVSTQLRGIGLGVMGLADALFKMRIPYNSDEAIEVAESIMKSIQDTSHEKSAELGEEKGNFPLFDKSIWKDIYDTHRNSTCTVIAPTGTISIINGCSSGIEPLFSFIFKRVIMDDDVMFEISSTFEGALSEKHIILSEKDKQQIYEEGTIKNIDCIPQDLKRVFVCAHDIEPSYHLKMQETFQKYVDCSVSKTINLPHDATLKEVSDVYRYAFDSKIIKGLTIYRDGSRADQPMQLETSSKESSKVNHLKYDWFLRLIEATENKSCISPAIKIKQNTPFGTLHVTLVFDENMNEKEVFAQLGKSGDIAAADIEAICRLSSKLLLNKYKLDDLIDQLVDIGTSLSLPTAEGKVVSIPDGLAKALLAYKEVKLKVNGDKSATYKEHNANLYKIKCPSCSGRLIYEEGCCHCDTCDYALC